MAYAVQRNKNIALLYFGAKIAKLHIDQRKSWVYDMYGFAPMINKSLQFLCVVPGGYRKILLLQITALPYENEVDNHEPQTATFHERVQYLYGGVLDLYGIYHCKTYRLFPVASGCFQHAY